MKKKNLKYCILCLIILTFANTIMTYGQEKNNFGEFWLGLNEMEKIMYFWGVRDGMVVGVQDMFSVEEDNIIGLSDDEKIFIGIQVSKYIYKRYSVISENSSVIIGIMDDLYEDSANSYIKFPYMVNIAINKLKGQDIEPLLRNARKEALNE